MFFGPHIPAILKVILVFITILICIRKNLFLGYAFLIGSLFLSLLFQLTPVGFLRSSFLSIIDPKTFLLAIIVALILILSNSMEISGHMDRLLKNFRGLVKNPGLNLIVFPALIGLLPMPGGAVFSAPMVKTLGQNVDIPADQLSFINYWYRHIWEYWWPMYPGVLLAVLMADISLSKFILFVIPFSAIAFMLGQGGLKNINSRSNAAGFAQIERPSIRPFLQEMVPILIVIIFGLGLGTVLSMLFSNLKINKEIGLIIALVASIASIWHGPHIQKNQIRTILKNPHVIKMMVMIFTIMIFKGILEDSRAVSQISDELIRLNIPIISVVMVVPLLVGLATGISVAFVGSTLPILVPLIHSVGESSHMLSYVILIMVSGFTGVILSPVHLCLLLTVEYFKTSMDKVYKFLILPSILLISSGFCYFWLVRYVQ